MEQHKTKVLVFLHIFVDSPNASQREEGGGGIKSTQECHEGRIVEEPHIIGVQD